MGFGVIKKNFIVVGLKGRGAYDHFGKEIPALAKQVLSRSGEIESHLGIEIALFEPKRGDTHIEGNYIVGFIVSENLKEVPKGMDVIEINQRYVTARGKISKISSIHSNLIKWAKEQGHARNLESYIVETYHPIPEEEEVQIYLPIH